VTVNVAFTWPFASDSSFVLCTSLDGDEVVGLGCCWLELKRSGSTVSAVGSAMVTVVPGVA